MKELFKLFVIIALSFLLSSNSFSLPVTVNGSVTLDYPDLTSAFDAINLGTHGSGAISVLINESHTLSSPATLIGGVFTSCEIKPAADVTVDSSPVILDGADHVTIDGRIGDAGSISLHLGNIDMLNGATNNLAEFIQSSGITISQSIPGSGGNNNNSVENCTVNGNIVTEGTGGSSGYTNDETRIIGNTCSSIKLGTETRDNLVEGNSMTGYFLNTSSYVKFISVYSVGINNIQKNKIVGYSDVLDGQSSALNGITISPTTLTAPGSNSTEINVTNNFVYVIAGTTCQFCSGSASGLDVVHNSNTTDFILNVFYNSLCIGCYCDGGYCSASDALGISISQNGYSGNSICNIKNNIVSIIGNADPGTGAEIISNQNITTNADYNCFYSVGYNYHGHSMWNNTSYSSLPAYRVAAYPNEQHTIFKSVNFASGYFGDLHLAGASIMDEELQGIQIPGITTDIDGELRNSPFMGADETDYLLPVELTSFTSSVNNNNVLLNWATASETNNSGFDIERREVRGETQDAWSKISFINGHGTTTTPNNYEFTDKGLNAGKYKYRLKQIDFNGNFEYYNLANEVVIGVPDIYSLSQNYPNPFNPSTNLEFGISNLEFVSLKVYNVLGKEVATLVNDELSPGMYEVKFDGSNLSSGVYFYKLTAGDFSAVKKMFLMK